MRKITLIILVSILLASCYNNKMYVGNIAKEEPIVQVQKIHNHHFIMGLVPGGNTKLLIAKYTKGFDNYVIKTNQSFLDGFLGGITWGIYTPTTTTIYIPLKDSKK